MGSEEVTASLEAHGEKEVFEAHEGYEMHASLLAVLGYVLLSGELCVLVGSEHVINVPGDTAVVGDKVDVKSA